MQYVDIAGDCANLSTTFDGVWRGKYPLYSVSESYPLDIFSIDPSPAIDYIFINNDDAGIGETANTIMIYNTLGQCVLTILQQLEGEQLRIDVSHLKPGVYFVRFGNRTEKFVKY